MSTEPTVPAGSGQAADAAKIRQRIAGQLVAHPAVAAATVLDDDQLTALVVPDERTAPVLYRACRLAASGALTGLTLHDAGGKLLVAQANRTEADFLYRELFEGNAYFRRGLGLPADPIVVDAGANIGMFSLLVSLYWPGARIVAVEPIAELARAVTVNAQIHGADVTVLNCALGKEPGATTLTYYPGNTLMSGIYGDQDEDREVLAAYLRTAPAQPDTPFDQLVRDRMRAEQRSCQVLTLTELAATQRIERIDLLKIDVEKAEADVLAGLDDATWPRIDQVALEVHDLDGRLAKITGQLRERGFAVGHDQDSRLRLTPCHTVYARRPDARPVLPGKVPVSLPAMSALNAELTAYLVARQPGLPVPARFSWQADAASPAQRATQTVPAVPAGPAAAALSQAWTEIFGTKSDRPDADFFDLGGDSLTAVRLLSKLEARLGEEIIEPDVIFTLSRFADLAHALTAALTSRAQSGVADAGQ